MTDVQVSILFTCLFVSTIANLVHLLENAEESGPLFLAAMNLLHYRVARGRLKMMNMTNAGSRSEAPHDAIGRCSAMLAAAQIRNREKYT